MFNAILGGDFWTIWIHKITIGWHNWFTERKWKHQQLPKQLQRVQFRGVVILAHVGPLQIHTVDRAPQLGKQNAKHPFIANLCKHLPIKPKFLSFFVCKQILTTKRGLTSARPMSTRPPSALAGGTATRLTSALHTTATVPNQRIGTAIGFAETVSQKSNEIYIFSTPHTHNC